MRRGSRRQQVATAASAVVLLVLVVGGVVVWWINRATRPPTPPPPSAASASREAPPPPPGTAATAAADAPAPAPSRPADAAADPLDDIDTRAAAWSAVDLDAVRAALPGNLYWELSAPTKDPDVLRAREAERERWNVEYGKVLSSTATADEVDAYYARRKRLSEDYVTFAGHLLLYYRDRLPKQDVALLKLAMDMNLARLEEIPRQLADAHQRREAHDAARRAWLEEQKTFEAPADAPASAPAE
jgi:hypothetical protein